jgi:hypothetical protein
MLVDKIFSSKCNEYYVRCTIVPEPNKASSTQFPKSYLSPVPDFVSKVAPDLIKKSEKEPWRAYYKLALRDKDGAPVGVSCVWVDIDLHEVGSSTNLTTLLNELQVPPTWTVFSGGGYHLYWLLDEPCFDIPTINAVLASLCEHFKGDTQQANVKGGLRLVGSTNWKWELNPKVTLLSTGTDDDGELLTYGIDEFPITETARKAAAEYVRDKGTALDIFKKYFPGEDTTAKTWLVSCPKHSDSTPSLSIDLEKGLWYCHSEKHQGMRGGTATGFYALMEGIELKEAEELVGNKGDVGAAGSNVLEQFLREYLTPVALEDYELICLDAKHNNRLIRIPSDSYNKTLIQLSRVLDGDASTILRKQVPAVLRGKMFPETLMGGIRNLIGKGASGKGILTTDRCTWLGQGLHHITVVGNGNGKKEKRTVLVNGENAYSWREHYDINTDKVEARWVKLDSVPIYGRYLVRPDDVWCPAYDPNADHDLIAVYKELDELLGAAWKWSDDFDKTMVALYTLYAPVHTWFGKTLAMFINGPSQSGKSALAEGWFAGERPGSHAMVKPSVYTRSASAAGIYQKYQDCTTLLVLDEIGDQTTRHAKQVTEMVRNLEAGDNTVVRGTSSGSTREYKLEMPIVWASINLPSQVQDLNRIIEIRLSHKAGVRDPWLVMRQMRTRDELKNLGSRGMYAMLKNKAEIMKCYDELEQKIAVTEGIDYRRGMILLPLFAIGAAVGLDIDKLVNHLVEESRAVEVETQEFCPIRELQAKILNTPIGLPGAPEVTKTIAAIINEDMEYDNPELGIKYLPMSDKNHPGRLAIHSTMAYPVFSPPKNPLGYGVVQFVRNMKELPGYDKAATLRTGDEGVPTWVHLIRADKLTWGTKRPNDALENIHTTIKDALSDVLDEWASEAEE